MAEFSARMIDSIYNEGGGTPIKFDPQKLKYNSNGIPILSVLEIEDIANELLQKYCPDVLGRPSMTPVVEIIRHLGQRTGLLFTMEDLGCNAPYSRRDYEATVSQLAQVFHVSKKSVRVRTRTLRLIEGEDRSENKTCRINPFTVLNPLQN